jgi:membrane-associated protease RseP (regulator of RpoE activity)
VSSGLIQMSPSSHDIDLDFPERPHNAGEPIHVPHPVISRRPERRWRYLLLFLLTFGTTTMAGGCHYAGFMLDFRPGDLNFSAPELYLNGLWYSVSILAILGAHEFGHYYACRYYGVDASLPYFLPAPLPLTGTLGAFIRIRQPIPTKRQLFDIGIAGPIAGFLVAVPVLLVGVDMSRVVELPPDFQGLELGEPLLFKALSWLRWGTPPDGYSINMHPMAFAAWFGLLATALNLFPIGQLDGGHISYAVLGRMSTIVTMGTVLCLIGLTFVSTSWTVWTVLTIGMLLAFGPRHPRTIDEDVPLDSGRMWLALFALIMFILCFTPAPIEPLDLVGRGRP